MTHLFSNIKYLVVNDKLDARGVKMNENVKHEVKRFYQLYTQGDFSQRDLQVFIGSFRDYSSVGGVLREVGDFLAHPKAKTKGVFVKSASNNLDVFEELLISGKKGLLAGFFSLSKVAKELEAVFSDVMDENVSISIEDKSFREFVFCLILLLDSYKMVFNGKRISGKYTAELLATYDNELSLILKVESQNPLYKKNYIEMNVLQLSNVAPQRSTLLGGSPISLKGFVAQRFACGSIGAVSRDVDQNLSSNTPLDKAKKRKDAYLMS